MNSYLSKAQIAEMAATRLISALLGAYALAVFAQATGVVHFA